MAGLRRLGAAVAFTALALVLSPPAQGLSCIPPPEDIWTTLYTMDGGAQTSFETHGPSLMGSGCEYSNDHLLGPRWFIWEETIDDGSHVQAMDRQRDQVVQLDYPAGAEPWLHVGDMTGDVAVHAGRADDGAITFYRVEPGAGTVRALLLRLPEGTTFSVDMGLITWLEGGGDGATLNVFDTASGRQTIQDVRVQARGGVAPDTLLAATTGRVVLAHANGRAGATDPWLYGDDGRAIRPLPDVDIHEGGIACARFDGQWLYYAYYEDSTPWFPMPARYHIDTGRHEAIGAFSHGWMHPCGPVVDGTIALFSDERPDGPVTDTREKLEGKGESREEAPAPTAAVLLSAMIATAIVQRLRR